MAAPKAGMMFNPNAGASPDYNEYDLMSKLAPLGADEDEIDRMREEAKRLKGLQGPQMRDTGRFKLAANPLEFLAHGVDQYRSQDLDRQATAQRRRLGTDTQTAVDTWIQRLRGSTAPQGTQAYDPSDPNNTMQAYGVPQIGEYNPFAGGY